LEKEKKEKKKKEEGEEEYDQDSEEEEEEEKPAEKKKRKKFTIDLKKKVATELSEVGNWLGKQSDPDKTWTHFISG